jgi:hypothetical protein
MTRLRETGATLGGSPQGETSWKHQERHPAGKEAVAR